MSEYEKITQQIRQVADEKYTIEIEERKLKELDELLNEHIYQKDLLFQELQETWQTGEMAHETMDRQLWLKKEQLAAMDELINEQEEKHKKIGQLEEKEEALYRKRKQL